MFTAFTHLWRRNSQDLTLAREAMRGVRGAGIPTFRESLPRLGLELRRARRYERTVAAIAVAPDTAARVNGGTPPADRLVAEIREDAVSVYLTFFVFGVLFREALRETDILAYSPERQYYAVLLPEADEAEARRALRRISKLVQDRMEIGIRAGVSEFPRHGITVEDLFARAHQEWNGPLWIGEIPVLKELSNG